MFKSVMWCYYNPVTIEITVRLVILSLSWCSLIVSWNLWFHKNAFQNTQNSIDLNYFNDFNHGACFYFLLI